MDNEERRQEYGRINPSWNVAEFTNHKEWLLKELQVTGFAPMEQQLTFNLYKVCDACPEGSHLL